MMLAKNNYEQRRLAFNGSKGDKSKLNQLKTEHQNLLNGKIDKQFMPANKNSIEEIEKRKIMKLSSCRGKTLERLFEINKDEKAAFYDDPKAGKPKKVVEINKFDCKIEEKSRLNATELKTWVEKDPKKIIRLKIAVPKKNSKRDIFFYTNDLFEAEYLKLEIEKNLLKNLRVPILTANEIFKSSIASHLSIQMRNAPIRQDNWDKISAVMEVFPDKFAEVMKKFGQKLVDKAKSKMNVKSKWVYDFKTLAQTFDEGQASNKSIKDGKIIVEDYGIQLINGSKPSDKIMVEDYDNLHAIFCEK